MGVKHRIRTSMVALGLLVSASAPAFAHEYFVDGNEVDLAPPFFTVREIVLERGKSVRIEVRDAGTCKARIQMTGDSSGLQVKNGDSKTAKVSHTITVTAKESGTFTAEISVKGEGTDKNGSPCTEDSVNRFLFKVSAPTKTLVKEFSKGWKGFGKTFKMELSGHRSFVSEVTKDCLRNFQSGSADGETALWGMYGAWTIALNETYMSGSRALTGYRDFGSDILSRGQVPEGCPPRSFDDGSGGAWDSAQTNVYSGTCRLAAALRKSATKSTAKFMKIGTQLDENWTINIGLRPLRDPSVSAPSIGGRAPEGDEGAHVTVFGGVSYRKMDMGTNQYVWAGGYADPVRGAFEVMLRDADGDVATKTVTPGSSGTWNVLFDKSDGIAAGFSYRLGVGYRSGGLDIGLSYDWEQVSVPKIAVTTRF